MVVKIGKKGIRLEYDNGRSFLYASYSGRMDGDLKNLIGKEQVGFRFGFFCIDHINSDHFEAAATALQSRRNVSFPGSQDGAEAHFIEPATITRKHSEQ